MEKNLSHLTLEQQIELGAYDNRCQRVLDDKGYMGHFDSVAERYLNIINNIKKKGILPIGEIASSVYDVIQIFKISEPDFCSNLYEIMPKELETYNKNK